MTSRWSTLVLRPTVIADCSLGSHNGNPVGGRWLVGGRWFLRFSKDTNGSITLRIISTSEWIMTLFAMASLIEFVPLLSWCILDPVRKLTHYFRVVKYKGDVPAMHRSCISRLVCIEPPVCYLSPIEHDVILCIHHYCACLSFSGGLHASGQKWPLWRSPNMPMIIHISGL